MQFPDNIAAPYSRIGCTSIAIYIPKPIIEDLNRSAYVGWFPKTFARVTASGQAKRPLGVPVHRDEGWLMGKRVYKLVWVMFA